MGGCYMRDSDDCDLQGKEDRRRLISFSCNDCISVCLILYQSILSVFICGFFIAAHQLKVGSLDLHKPRDIPLEANQLYAA